MTSNKLKALSSKNRSDWANSSFTSKDRELFCVNTFLYGCPIPGVSASGKPLQALSTVDNGLAAQTLANLFGDLDADHYFCNSELRQVAKQLIKLKFDGTKVPTGNKEFLIFSKSSFGVLKDHYGLFQEREKRSLRAEDARPYDSLLILDAVYRHLRNVLAHGSFTEVKRKSSIGKKLEPYLYLQDSNHKSQITARCFISKSRLCSLAEILK